MADDFKPSPPKFNIYWSDDEGNIDFKDTSRQSGLWEKEKDGKTFYTGKVKNTNRRFVMFPVVPRDQDEEEEW